MKLLRFYENNQIKPGVLLENNKIADVSSLFNDFDEKFFEWLAELERIVEAQFFGLKDDFLLEYVKTNRNYNIEQRSNTNDQDNSPGGFKSFQVSNQKQAIDTI